MLTILLYIIANRGLLHSKETLEYLEEMEKVWLTLLIILLSFMLFMSLFGVFVAVRYYLMHS